MPVVGSLNGRAQLLPLGGTAIGITALKMFVTFPVPGGVPSVGANSTNCFVKSPGEHPGTSINSATLV